MIHIIDFLPSLKVPEGRGFLLVPRLSGNNRLQYVLTCVVVEPPDEALPAARARAKARYAKILRLAGEEVATRNQATLEQVLTHSK